MSEEQLASFEESLGLGDQLWRVRESLGSPIVFVRTDVQAQALNASDIANRWADAHFAMARAPTGDSTRGARAPKLRVGHGAKIAAWLVISPRLWS